MQFELDLFYHNAIELPEIELRHIYTDTYIYICMCMYVCILLNQI